MTYDNPRETVIIDLKNAPPPLGLRILRVFLRLLLTILVGAVLGSALFFGARSYYRQAVMMPAEQGVTRMDDLAGRQSLLATQSIGEIEDLGERIGQLEKDRKADAEEISALQAEVGLLENQMDESRSSLQQLDALQRNVEALATQAMQNNWELDSYVSSSTGPVSELRREIQLLRAMELLNRCRLYLSQNNYGLVEQDAGLVRQIFLDIKNENPGQNQALLDTWIARLDLALSNLTVAPVLAGEDLEMVWRMVLLGLPEQEAPLVDAAGLTFTPTPTPWVTSTPTPYETPTTTPIPGQPNPIPNPT